MLKRLASIRCSRKAMMVLILVAALTVSGTSTALAANGGNFILGASNSATAATFLLGNFNGQSLIVDNPNTGASATALRLIVPSSRPPMIVNSSTKVANLNSDKLDGYDSKDLPGLISSIGRFQGSIGSISGDATDFVFAGPTTTVTTNSTQSLVGSAEAPLASTGGAGNSFYYGLCYQPSGGSTISDFVGGSFSQGAISTQPIAWAAAASVVPGAGKWKVGFCVWNFNPAAIDNTDYVNGWVQVVNQPPITATSAATPASEKERTPTSPSTTAKPTSKKASSKHHANRRHKRKK